MATFVKDDDAANAGDAAAPDPVGGIAPRGRDAIVAAVLDAAERLFAAQGPDDVSLRAVAAEAGVTYSLVNRHLGTRGHIIDALLARSEQRWRERADGASFAEALHMLLGADPDTGSYLRLLASSLLRDGADLAAHRDHARLHELIPLAADALGVTRSPPLGDPAAASKAVSGATAAGGPNVADPHSGGGAPSLAQTGVAASLAFVFGWRLFHPFIVSSLRLPSEAAADLHAAMHSLVDMTLAGELANPTPT